MQNILFYNCIKLLSKGRTPCIKKLITSGYATSADFTSSENLGTEEENRTKKTSTTDWNTKVLDAITPLWRYPYEEQLLLKKETHKSLLKKLAELTATPNTEQHNGMCCPLDVLPSPIINHYRNKSEYSVGRGPEGELSRVVGFYVGKYGKGACIPPLNLPSEKLSHISLAQAYNQYIQESPLDIMISFTGSGPGGKEDGYWRECCVKSNDSGDHMLIIKFHPRNLTQVDINKEKNKLKSFFTSPKYVQSLPNLTSLYFQESTSTRQNHYQAPYSLLHGQEYIYASLLGSKFRLSPDSFFQCNTSAAEVLYTQLKESCNINKNTVLLDICCGVGSIGISMASLVKKVIGIEVMEQSIEDAAFNAELNNVKNVEFLCGRVEKILPNLLTHLKGEKDLVAVVNPGRTGLAPQLIKAIRKCSYLNRLAYISCKPEGEAMKNVVDLCDPSGLRKIETPFQPIKAFSVDMFPHTLHCELVYLFER